MNEAKQLAVISGAVECRRCVAGNDKKGSSAGVGWMVHMCGGFPRLTGSLAGREFD